MGYLINHRKIAKVIPTEHDECKAPDISSILHCRSWEGHRCFILCGGPSLENFDFTPLQKELTIGVNKTFIRFPTTICFAIDQRLYDSVTYPNRKDSRNVELHAQWLKYSGIKVFVKYPGKWRFDSSIYVVKAIKRKVISLDLSTGIYPGNNSGFGAMMLAIALGSTQIYLLGCDMKVDRQKRRTHWHDGYVNQRFEALEAVLPKFAKEFSTFADTIQKQGIEVVNLNPDSALECFPKEDIRNIV